MFQLGFLQVSGVIVFGLCFGCLAAESKRTSKEKELLDHLLDGYEPRVRPVANVSSIVNVSFSLTLQQIVDLDEKNQLLTTSMYMGWGWFDDFLTWNPSDYGGITNIRIPSKYVWVPDILIYNSAVSSFDQMLRTNVIVYNTGEIEWLPPGLFQTTCDVDIRYFPFDEQKCKIKFGTWTYHGGLVDLYLKTADAATDSYTESGAWDLISMRGKKTSITYDCCPDPFVDITYTIHIRRRTLFYGFNLILPCILVCALTILVFILPADSGERITLGVTILLALVVFLQIVADNLPPTDAIPLLGKFFACSIVMVAASVLVTVVSLNFHFTNASNTNEMPQYIRWIFLYALPYVLRMKRPGENSFKRKFLDHPEDNNEKSESYPLVKIGGRLDQNPNMHQTKEMTSIGEATDEMKSVLEEIRFITSKMHNDDEDEKTALEWQFAATVLDKFCLYFFTLFVILSIIFTIVIAPGALLPLPEE